MIDGISLINCDARQTAATIEHPIADSGDAVGDRDACQTAAIIERALADGSDAVGDHNARQTAATIERISADGSDAIRDRDVRQSVAPIKRTITNGSDAAIGRDHACTASRDQGLALRFDQTVPRTMINLIFGFNRNTRQPATVPKCTHTDRCNAFRDRDACQIAATRERPLSNGNDAIGNHNACQAAAPPERSIANGSDAVRDRDARQTVTKRESPIADGSDRQILIIGGNIDFCGNTIIT